jgi:signal transduction histidine kinase
MSSSPASPIDAFVNSRVLLIDDHPINFDLIEGMLEGESDIVISYLDDPLRATEAAQAFAPTVILLDLHMPTADGLDVIRALKQEPRLAEVPIVMLSSNASPQVKAEGFAAGAMDYLVKWPDRIELAARLRAHSRAYRTIVERDQARSALAEAHASLLEAQKMEAIGELTGGVAHDFNNVLQLISGHLQLLRITHRADERTVRRLELASEGVRRGAHLAEQLLAFARRQPLQPVTVRADALLRGMKPALRQALDGRSLAIASDADDANERAAQLVSLDQQQFEKAILQVVHNAVDATGPDGHLEIDVTASPGPGLNEESKGKGDAYVRIRLTDNGCGMPEEVQRRAFEPFFSTRAGQRRSGIGLSLAFAFVKQSGGHIELASKPGEGTSVTMYFPAARAPAGAYTVLVVEDEAPVRNVSVEVLRKLGLCVLEAADGESALGLIRQQLPIDLVFTDIVMPGPTRGQDLALAAAQYLPEAQVLFTSGYPGEMERYQDNEIGRGVPLLRKPYRLDEMTRLVQEMLAKRIKKPPVA